MTKKHKKIIAAVIVIILAFLALMYCKIIPSVIVNKAISAINNDDVSAYKKYSSMIGNFPYSFGEDDVLTYLKERETDVADEVNEEFQDFETTSEIEKYVKDNYPLIYRCCLKDDKGWGIINSRIDSKQKCIELNKDVDELSQHIETLKSQMTSSARDSINATTDISLELQICLGTLQSLDAVAQATVYDDDLTYVNKIEPILDDLGSELEEMEQEINEW